MGSYLHMLTTSMVSSGDGEGGGMPVLPHHGSSLGDDIKVFQATEGNEPSHKAP